ncbi:MAG: hypothetical protein ABIU11_05990 [Chitinophagaceae bacterium]
MSNTIEVFFNGDTGWVIENKDERKYLVHFKDKEAILFVKEDNEGANHWFENDADRETDFSKEIGLQIEKNYV